MKINRFPALATIGLLAVGAMSLVATRSFAQGQKPVAQSQSCDQQDNSGDVSGSDPSTNNANVQCGDQNAPDIGQVVSGAEQAAPGDGQDPAPSGTPAITVEQAQAAALAVHSGTIIKTELNDEDGKLVYSVQFNGDVDVKVDAMTGAVLSTDTGQN
jgi:uncharacterized membrane protein YkoI